MYGTLAFVMYGNYFNYIWSKFWFSTIILRQYKSLVPNHCFWLKFPFSSFIYFSQTINYSHHLFLFTSFGICIFAYKKYHYHNYAQLHVKGQKIYSVIDMRESNGVCDIFEEISFKVKLRKSMVKLKDNIWTLKLINWTSKRTQTKNRSQPKTRWWDAICK